MERFCTRTSSRNLPLRFPLLISEEAGTTPTCSGTSTKLSGDRPMDREKKVALKLDS